MCGGLLIPFATNFEVRADGVDLKKPLLYMWEIFDRLTGKSKGRYVGKAKRGARRPCRHYSRNVRNLLAKEAYRPSNKEGYRLIHRALARAVEADDRIVLTLLRNVNEDEDINVAEQRAIQIAGATLNVQRNLLTTGL